MKPKISIISTLPPTKGLSPYTLGLVKELSKKANIEFYGFKSIYPEFMYPGGTKTNESEPKIKNVNIHNYLSWYNPFSWINVGFKINTPIVHAQWWSWFLAPVYYTVLKIARMRDKKIIMTIHNVKPHEKSFIKDFLNNSVIGLADEYIVHSEENKRQFLELNNTKKKIYVIPHGIIEFAKSNLSKEQLLKKYNFTKQDKIILFFGNIRPYKGLDVLIKSLPNISNKNVKLIIAGKPWGSFEEYQKIIDELNLKDKITLFLDFNTQEKIAELFKISDLAAFPYKEFEASSGAAATALFYE
ncbi:MAG TPA: glycosyltransferase, partial [Candidatus Nanoarchaeia archaeon]|nr:glycosyltransferase [Candidatus Nanoarchaeia archaeon]